MKKKVLSILISSIMCFGILGGTFSASAASVSVHLTKNQASNSSSNVYGSYKYYWGNNKKESKHSVYLIAKYKSGGIWFEDSFILMQSGYSLSETNAKKTRTLSKETDWFVKLNPEGALNKDCDAWGYIKNA